MNRGGFKTLAEWESVPEAERIERIAYEVYREVEIDTLAEQFQNYRPSEEDKGNHSLMTAEVKSLLTLALLG